MPVFWIRSTGARQVPHVHQSRRYPVGGARQGEGEAVSAMQEIMFVSVIYFLRRCLLAVF
jgi:hypothetical protein